MLPDILYGSIVSWRVPPKDNSFFIKIFGYLQIFFTGMDETHSSIILDRVMYYEEGELIIQNEYYEFESSKITGINKFIPNKNCTVFGLNASREVMEKIINRLIKKHYGKVYGIIQTFYFIFRWMMEGIGVDVRRWWNPLGFIFLVCSELVYEFVLELAMEMDWNETVEFLMQWNKNTFHSGDTRLLCNFMVENKRANKIIGV